MTTDREPGRPEAAFWEAELRRFLPDPAAALTEAREYVCCPVCWVLGHVPFAYFGALAKRWAEEEDLRRIVCASGGFCHHHTWQLHKLQSGHTVATAFLQVLLARLDDDLPPRPCPVCHLQRLMDEDLLPVFVAWLSAPPAQEEYRALFGLCHPHCRAVLALELDDATRAVLVEAQRCRTQALIEHLQGFLARSGPKERPARTHDEQHAPRRALLKTAGNEDR